MANNKSLRQTATAPRGMLRHSHLTACIFLALGGGVAEAAMAAPAPAPAIQAVEFTAGFLGDSAGSVDVSRFSNGNPMPLGDHRVDIYVNEYLVSRELLSFRADAPDSSPRPCFNRANLTLMGVDVAKLEAGGATLDGDCLDLEQLVPGAIIGADAGELALNVSIPQVAMLRNPRGYVDPKLWDRGMNAFTLGYNVNAVDSDSRAGNNGAVYLGFDSGLNLGGWRIRNQGNFQWTEGDGSKYQNIRTYAQHDIDRLQSQLTIGDTFTSGQLFDSVAMRGASLATDDRMRPDSMSGYAPVIRGVAETHARVLVRQAGYVIHETTVAPGNFEIGDLSATGFGGDLVVTIIEADGRERTFNVPFAAVPNLLRPGVSRYSVTAGQLRDEQFSGSVPNFVEATYQRGLNNTVTAYAGAQSTTSGLYRGAVVGAAFNTPVGALSTDITTSRANFGSGNGGRSGYSARATFSKSIPQTKTDFALAAYRFSSKGYLGLADASRVSDAINSGELGGGAPAYGSQRSRLQLTVSQSLGKGGGQLYASGSRTNFWGVQSDETNFNVGYSNRYRSMSYGVSANRSMLPNGKADDTFYVNLSVPLGNSMAKRRAPTLSFQGTRGSDSGAATASLNGTLGANNQYNYGATGTLGEGTDNVSINAGWRAPYGTLSGSYTHASDGIRQSTASASGALVIHGGGLTLAPELGETIGVVEAKGAKGARLASDINAKVDGRGYAIAANLSPYRMNDIMVDPKGISAGVELGDARLQVAPRAGAVVPLKFEVSSGVPYLLQLVTTEGSPVPFGAEVRDSNGTNVGYVGQGGQALVRLADQDNAPHLSVHWGGSGEQCTIEASFQASGKGGQALQATTGVCRKL